MVFSFAEKWNVTFTACSCNGKPLQLRLTQATILWEPSVYGGDGTELRQNIVFTVSDEMRQKIEAMEQSLGNATSCIKDGALKCKINMDRVSIFDAARNRIEKPLQFRGWTVNAQITVRGKWETKTMRGLCMETSDIQLLQPLSEPACPF